ncbi:MULTISPECIES: hypothetical protein [unclassified Vibrio]|uniref:hypothetical protein n=1 Tax=unclassified Vibrio TaxID=2614977 RepID=UPI000C84D760|nr:MULTISPECIES: hypothetical protein [unclassified Vibrio]PMK74897.1 hypothetical protein BCT92_23925 [Vibrio sp. 10N.261.52.E5]TKF76176.1 hypothetical protein FCV65_24770 [Vibrio sp. F13]
MSEGILVYYSSNDFENIINKVRKDVGYSTNKRFLSDCAKRNTFDLKSSEIKINNDQFNRFQANKAQLIEIDDFFMNSTSDDKKVLNSKTLVSDYEDIDLMIKDLHIKGSESAKTTELKDLHYAENGDVGLSVYATQYNELYIKILEQALYKFDYKVATPNLVQLTEDHQYIVELRRHLEQLSDFKNTNETYAQRGMKKRRKIISDKDLIEQELNEFKEVDESQTLESQHSNKEIVSVLINTVGQLDKVNLNRAEAKSCISQIQEIMSKLNQPIKNKKTTAMYLLESLRNIKLVGYDYEPKAEAISSKFRSNMNRLNSAITDYHSFSRSNEVTKQGRYKRAARVKYILRQVAIQNYNLVKQYQ